MYNSIALQSNFRRPKQKTQMGRKCCIKVKKCKKSCSSSSSSSSSSSCSSSSSSSSCCPLPCPGNLVLNASGGAAGTVATEEFTLTSSNNMNNVTISTVSTYVGPTNNNVKSYKKKQSKCCPLYLTVTGNLVNGSAQVVTVSNSCYGGAVTYSNPITVASNTTTSSNPYTATLAPNQAIAFVPNLTTDGASSITFQYAPLNYPSKKCC